MNNPFNTKIETKSPTFTLSAMALLLGVLFGFAWVTNEKRGGSAGLQSPVPVEINEQLKGLQAEVGRLRKKVGQYESDNSNSELVQQSLREYRLAAGLTEVSGPGVIITLSDAKNAGSGTFMPVEEGIIHDSDVLKLVNELKVSGAEAIAVEDQRIVANTAIRCVGTVIHVNFVPVAAPMKIRAIGDPETLRKAMALPGGIVEEFLLIDPGMFKLEMVKKMTIPAYKGQTATKLGVVPGENKR